MPQKTSIFVLSLVAVLWPFALMPGAAHAEDRLTYSQLRQLIKTGKTSQIQKVAVTNGTPDIEVQLAGSDRMQVVTVPSETKERLINSLDDAGVPLEVHRPDQTGFLFSMISSFFLPILLLVGFLFMFRSAQGSSRRQHPTIDSH